METAAKQPARRHGAPDERQGDPGEAAIVLGLGNPCLGDDGVGWRVAELLRDRLAARQEPGGGAVEVDCLAVGGLRLMERLVGYRRAVLIDAIATGRQPAGTVAARTLASVAGISTHLGSSHDASLAVALAVGEAYGAALPDEVLLVTVEAGPSFEFGETLSPPVAAAVPRAAERVLELLS